MIINENFVVVGINFGEITAKGTPYDVGNITNLSACLHVNSEYNPIATFLQD